MKVLPFLYFILLSFSQVRSVYQEEEETEKVLIETNGTAASSVYEILYSPVGKKSTSSEMSTYGRLYGEPVRNSSNDNANNTESSNVTTKLNRTRRFRKRDLSGDGTLNSTLVARMVVYIGSIGLEGMNWWHKWLTRVIMAAWNITVKLEVLPSEYDHIITVNEDFISHGIILLEIVLFTGSY